MATNTNIDNKQLLLIAKRITQEVCLQLQNYQKLGSSMNKVGVGGDIIRLGDQIMEDGLRMSIPSIIQDYGINDCWVISEEIGEWTIGNKQEPSGLFMIVDPIDGSRNMRPHHTPRPVVAFSIAIGRLKDLFNDGTLSSVSIGVVRDIFQNGVYYAEAGGGAFLDGIHLQSSPITDISEASVGMSLNRGGARIKKMLDEGLYNVLVSCRRQRGQGLCTLDLCMVATGDYDGYLTLSGEVKVHDIAATSLIVKEAGGMVRLFKDGKDVTGEPLLRWLYEQGNEGVKNIKFKLIAGGNETILNQIKSLVTL